MRARDVQGLDAPTQKPLFQGVKMRISIKVPRVGEMCLVMGFLHRRVQGSGFQAYVTPGHHGSQTRNRAVCCAELGSQWFKILRNTKKMMHSQSLLLFCEVLVGDIVAGKYLRECLIIK